MKADNFLKIYSIMFWILIILGSVYFITLDITTTTNMPDFILSYILCFITFVFLNIVFFAPFFIVYSISLVISTFMIISPILFNMLALTELAGGSIEVLQYNYLLTLLMTIVASFIGQMNICTIIYLNRIM